VSVTFSRALLSEFRLQKVFFFVAEDQKLQLSGNKLLRKLFGCKTDEERTTGIPGVYLLQNEEHCDL
jgi:hypothetical protein